MTLNIDVYLTTKLDALPDLKSYTKEEQFYNWKSQVKGVAFQHESYSEVSEDLLTEAGNYPILEAYALIEYPTGKVLEADEEVGEKLRTLFGDRHIKFDWALTRDESAMQDVYNVSLEIIVDKKD
jgi:hypothetical protein